jgi:fructosamine-3-kinase
MTRLTAVARRAEALLGTAVIATSPVAGGDTCTSTRLRLSDGTTALIKTHPHSPGDFFATEAAGLAWLAASETLPVPAVLAVDTDCLIVRWVESGKPSGDAAATFGAGLARLHASGVGPGQADGFGAKNDGYIGTLRLPNQQRASWAEFYAEFRVRPYLALSVDRGAIEPADAAVIEKVVGRIGDWVPEEPTARLHGDLWNGNVLWNLEGSASVIDPAAYAGHRETDLAMLALFGLPHLSRTFDAYEAEHPLAEGWMDRLGLHQLFPLLVHAARFGGGYGPRAATVARRFAS